MSSSVRRILIVNLTRLGDLLQTSPSVAVLRELYPEAEITFAAEKNFAEVCDALPGIDHVYRVDLDRLGRLLLDGGERLLDAYGCVRELVDELRAMRFDLAFNFSSSRMSAVLMGLLEVPDVRGWSMTSDGFRVIRHPWSRLFAAMCLNRSTAAFNLVDVYRSVAGRGRGPRRLLYDVAPEAEVFAGELLAAAELCPGERVVALQLGASKSVRCWPQEAFAELGRRLGQAGLRVLLVGGGGDRGLAAEVAKRIGPGVIDACGRTTVAQLGALLARTSLLVTGDTGPMHMAAAVETPVVSLFFGPALPFDTGPYGAGHLMIQAMAPCAPCDHNVSCLNPFCRELIAPEAVAEAVLARLADDSQRLEALGASSPGLRLYRGRFDSAGYHDCEPLGMTRPDRQAALRIAYRAMWLALLEGVDLPEPLASGVDITPFVELGAMAREGEEITRRMRGLLAVASTPIAQVERLGRELEALDRQIAEAAGLYPELGVLAHMFQFGKENLEGVEVGPLVEESSGLYRDLGWSANCMRTLLGEGTGRRELRDAGLHQ